MAYILEKERFLKWKNHITPIMNKLSSEIKYESIIKQTITDYIKIMDKKVN